MPHDLGGPWGVGGKWWWDWGERANVAARRRQAAASFVLLTLFAGQGLTLIGGPRFWLFAFCFGLMRRALSFTSVCGPEEGLMLVPV